MKKRMGVCFLCIALLFMLFPSTAKADMGPKPSVHITFENMGDETCYGTLLSETESVGPYSAWDGSGEHAAADRYGADIWRAFAEYQDSDGYYFLQEIWLCSETKELNWTYYPPYSFKILLYYPETNTFAVSGIYERYAFDSYFSVNMDGIGMDSVDSQGAALTAEKNYDYTWELVSFACRVVMTILIETGVALLFGFRQKKMLRFIICVNVVTQVILNVLLNGINYSLGSMLFTSSYVLLEGIVFAVEAVLYCRLLGRVSETVITKGKCVSYALIANACSFAGGFLIAKWIPGIF